MTPDLLAALYAILTGAVAGAGTLVAGRAYRRLKARQASRRARIADIEESYRRDMR